MEKSFHVPSGTYVLAVSGGVDSMVLLDLVRRNKQPDCFVVAHFKHNVRGAEQSERDYAVIHSYCQQYNLKLETGEYKGATRDEASLRTARYTFLDAIREQYDYNSVITAHHKDDVVETAILNLLRGTQGAGLVALSSTQELNRPLLEWSKEDILKYAETHDVVWHEDSTNDDERYLRNYIRKYIVSKMRTNDSLADFIDIVAQQQPKQALLEAALMQVAQSVLIETEGGGICLLRKDFIQLPHDVSRSLLWYVFRQYFPETEMSRREIEKLVVFAKTARLGASTELGKRLRATVTPDFVEFFHYS